MENMTFNKYIAKFALNYSKKDIDEQAWETAKNFFIDTVGCMIAGANEKPSIIIGDYAKSIEGKKVCSVIGRKDFKVDPYSAIMINGTSSHFHDVDDVIPSTDGHPSVAILPGVLAAAEMLDISGEDTFMAYLTGIQVLKYVGVAFNKNGRYYSLGWHSTSTLGIFGATAAIGRMFKLTEDELVYALSISASESAGLKGNFGTMVKPFHAGKCGADAFLAVQLAKGGFISNPAVMEGNEGFSNVTTKTIDFTDFLDEIQKNESAFIKPGLNIKPWPCCKQNHSSINAIQNLKSEYAFSADDVDKVECLVQPISFDCLKYTAPKTKLQGKFSIQYNVALAILNGNVTLSDYDGDLIEDKSVKDLMKKITIEIDDSIAGGKYGNGKYDSKIKVYLKDGQVLNDWVIDAKGDSTNPLSFDEVLDKFKQCASRALDMDNIGVVLNCIMNIDKLETIKELIYSINDAAKY